MNESNIMLRRFLKIRELLIDKNKFQYMSAKVEDQVKKSHFFNKNNNICVYNYDNSVLINGILTNDDTYFKNSFVFPKLNNGSVSLYLVPEQNYLVMNKFGIQDIAYDGFELDINDIDVILVPGIAFDHKGNWLNDGNNKVLYDLLLKKATCLKVGVCLECQIYNHDLPDTDNKVDCLLTEEGIFHEIDIGEITL